MCPPHSGMPKRNVSSDILCALLFAKKPNIIHALKKPIKKRACDLVSLGQHKLEQMTGWFINREMWISMFLDLPFNFNLDSSVRNLDYWIDALFLLRGDIIEASRRQHDVQKWCVCWYLCWAYRLMETSIGPWMDCNPN